MFIEYKYQKVIDLGVIIYIHKWQMAGCRKNTKNVYINRYIFTNARVLRRA